MKTHSLSKGLEKSFTHNLFHGDLLVLFAFAFDLLIFLIEFPRLDACERARLNRPRARTVELIPVIA